MTTTPNTTIALPVAPGPDTPGAIVTHHGNYIIPASTDGTATCATCGTDQPVTKFPTKPYGPDAIVTRATTCRRCRDAKTACRKSGQPVPTNGGMIVPRPTVHYVPSTIVMAAPTVEPDAVPLSADSRMAQRWNNATPGMIPPNAIESADATDRAMGGAGIVVAA